MVNSQQTHKAVINNSVVDRLFVFVVLFSKNLQSSQTEISSDSVTISTRYEVRHDSVTLLTGEIHCRECMPSQVLSLARRSTFIIVFALQELIVTT